MSFVPGGVLVWAARAEQFQNPSVFGTGVIVRYSADDLLYRLLGTRSHLAASGVLQNGQSALRAGCRERSLRSLQAISG